MMSESKRIKKDSSSPTPDCDVSLLPYHMKILLERYMNEDLGQSTLDFGQNNIDDKMMPELCKWLEILDGNLKSISFFGNPITSKGVSTLFDTLKATQSSIKWIYLNFNKHIQDECMKSLGEYIRSNTFINGIYLWDCKISDAGIEILAPYLEGNITFKKLFLNGNEGITSKSIPFLVKIIEASHIEDISISNTSVSNSSILTSYLACNKIKNGSTSLNLSATKLDDNDIIKICEEMKKYGIDKLKEIRLSKNNITSAGASMLFDTLKECNSVVSNMDLSYNQLEDECMKQLGEYIDNNDQIDRLSIDNNLIANEGVEILSEYLIGNFTLRELTLSSNHGITDKSVAYFLEMITRSCISTLDINQTSISLNKEQNIKEALKVPTDKRDIPVKSRAKSAAKVA